MVDREAVAAAVSRQMAAFPESRLQDLYKSFFQDRFGPGHIIRDRESARKWIMEESARADSLTGPLMEPCGWEGNYVRVNLSAVAVGLVGVDELTDALMASAEAVTDEDVRQWKEEWAVIVKVIERNCPVIPGLAQDKAMLDSLLASGHYACHHSMAYEAAYHPHYRVIKADLAVWF